MPHNSPYLILHDRISSVVVSLLPQNKYLEICYALWMDARSLDNGGTFILEEFVQRAQELFGYSRQHLIRNVLPVGTYFFWSINKGKLTIFGKRRVCKILELDNPGKAYNVPRENIFNKLKVLRATLWSYSVGGTIQSKRSTMVKNFKRTAQTFWNYQNTSEIKVIHNFTKEVYVNPETGEVYRKQLPNYYVAPESFSKTPNHKKYGWIKDIGQNLGNRSKLCPLYQKRYFSHHTELNRWIRNGWLLPNQIVYVRNRYHHPHNGFWNEWEEMFIPDKYDVIIFMQ